MKIVNIDGENLHIFLMKGKMCLMIILKVTKKQDFTLSLEDTVLEKPHGGSQIDPLPSCLRVNM